VAWERRSMTSVESAIESREELEDGLARPAPAGPPARSPAANPDPAELARRAGEGCVDSFALLVHQFSPRVFNYLLRMTRHHQDAQDLTQETFLKAYRALGRHQRPRSFQAWIFTIARRTALNQFRSARPLEELRPDSQVDARDPSALAAEKDDRRSLWRVVNTLKPRQREVLWLHYAEGLSIEEAARVTNLGQIHVRVLLHRARAQLARRLRRNPRESDGPTDRPHSARRTL